MDDQNDINDHVSRNKPFLIINKEHKWCFDLVKSYVLQNEKNVGDQHDESGQKMKKIIKPDGPFVKKQKV